MSLQQKKSIPTGSAANEQSADTFKRQAYFIQQVTNATPDMIFVLNIQQDRLGFVNAPTAKLLGKSEEELYQNGPQLFKERVHPDDLKARTRFHQNLHTLKDEEVRVIEIRLKVADSSYRWYKLRDKVFERDSEGRVLQTICIAQEINERVQAQQESARLLGKQQKTEAETYKKMISQVLSTLEEDQKRVAESMQEGLGQMLFAVKLKCDQVALDPDFKASISLQQYKSEVTQLLKECIRESRRISKGLMPSHIEHFGLVESIKDLCKGSQSKALTISCSVTGFKTPVEKYLQLTLYRMAQELILNIVRHAGATIATVKLSRGKEKIRLEVYDNGHSYGALKTEQHGLGLKLIKSKVELLRGSFEMTADHDEGTKVSIAIPI
jgi:two-component system NarL family sensor kinase